jgi:hypothetical protein
MKLSFLGIVVCAVALLACGSSDGTSDGPPCEDDGAGGCRCGGVNEPLLSECSEESAQGTALCCDSPESDVCVCSSLACSQRSDLDYCSCGLRGVVLDDTQTEVTSCASGGAITCCLSPGVQSCRCTELACGSGQTEVTTCDTDVISDCGSWDQVAACL